MTCEAAASPTTGGAVPGVPVWHPSTKWHAAAVLPTDATQAGSATAEALWAVCCSRDAGALQLLLSRDATCISDALDAAGNTALHAVLLPWSPDQPAATWMTDAAAAAAEDILKSSCNNNSRASSLSWITGCFGAAARGTSGSPRPQTPAAAAAAQQSMVAALLAAGADVNVRDKQQGCTPLMLAVQQLVHACSSTSSSALMVPALRVIKLLCKHVLCDVNMKDAQGRTALALLLQGPQPLAAAAASAAPCRKHSSSSSKQRPPSKAATAASVGQLRPPPPASAAAAAYSHVFSAAQLKAVQMLLHKGADCNSADHAGMTPLMFAAAAPGVSKELLHLLLQRGANTRQLDNNRRSALTHALLAHNLRLLPAVGAAQQPGGSATNNSSSSTKGIIKAQGQTCAPQTCSGCKSAAAAAAARAWPTHTPSAAAAKAQAALQQGGAAADAPAAHSSSSSSEHNDSSAGPDLHAQVQTCASCSACTCSTHSSSTSSSSTGVLPAAPNPRHSMVVKALCSYGALDLHPGSINTHFPGLSGFSQLHIAVRRGDVMALQMLLAGGADVNATDTWGNSALMYWPVCPTEPEELVEELVGKLLSHGADPNLENDEGWNALDLACELNKLGRVVVKPQQVPVHALLVGWGARNSEAFKAQYRNPPPMLCMRTDSANSFIRNSKGFGSIRVVSLEELEHQVAALREDTSV